MSPPLDRIIKKPADEAPPADVARAVDAGAPADQPAAPPAATPEPAKSSGPPPMPNPAEMPATLAVWAQRRSWPKWLAAAVAVNRPVNEEFTAAAADELAQKTRALPLGRKGA